jgi:hypothetical protein
MHKIDFKSISPILILTLIVPSFLDRIDDQNLITIPFPFNHFVLMLKLYCANLFLVRKTYPYPVLIVEKLIRIGISIKVDGVDRNCQFCGGGSRFVYDEL